jgi:hypothetical protein
MVTPSLLSVTGLGLYDRRVHIYAHEYRVYGPDGLRVLFERNAQGVFVKRSVTLDAQGSIATVTDAAGYQHAEIHDDHGERTTVPQRRTGNSGLMGWRCTQCFAGETGLP